MLRFSFWRTSVRCGLPFALAVAVLAAGPAFAHSPPDRLHGGSGEGVTVIGHSERAAKISKGRWSLNSKLSPSIRTQIARRCGTVHSYTLFTGYFPRRIRGEQRSLQVLPSR